MADMEFTPLIDYLESGGGGGGSLNNVVEDTTPQLGGQLDVNGQAIGDGTRELITFTEDASAVNHINIENEATGSGPIIRSAGDDTNVDLNIQAKGSGNIVLGAFTIDADQSVGAGQDNYVLTYDNGTGLVSLEAAAGGLADGDYGDVTISGSGTAITIDAPTNVDPAADDEILIKDTSDSNNTKSVTISDMFCLATYAADATTTAITLTASDRGKIVKVTNSTASHNINLPDATSVGEGYVVGLCVDNTVETYYHWVYGSGGQTINNHTNGVPIDPKGGLSLFFSDGAQWFSLRCYADPYGLTLGTLAATSRFSFQEQTGGYATKYTTLTNLATAVVGDSAGAEAIQDLAGAMWTGNTETAASVTYQDADGTIDIDASLVLDTAPQLGGQLDVNGNAIGDGTRELITFTEDASAVNQINIENEATGSGPIISAAGDDTNIDLNLVAKGSGNVKVGVYTFDGDQTVGAGQDNYVLTYDNGTGTIQLEAAAGGGLTEWTAASATGASKLDFYEDTDFGTNKKTIAGPSSISSDATFTLPNTTDGYLMSAGTVGSTYLLNDYSIPVFTSSIYNENARRAYAGYLQHPYARRAVDHYYSPLGSQGIDTSTAGIVAADDTFYVVPIYVPPNATGIALGINTGDASATADIECRLYATWAGTTTSGVIGFSSQGNTVTFSNVSSSGVQVSASGLGTVQGGYYLLGIRTDNIGTSLTLANAVSTTTEDMYHHFGVGSDYTSPTPFYGWYASSVVSMPSSLAGTTMTGELTTPIGVCIYDDA